MTAPVTIFLFAHQDDEMGVLPILAELAAAKRRVFCFYLTDGGFRGENPERRNSESLRVLDCLGIGADSVRFIGAEQRIPDGSLAEHFATADQAISACLKETGPIERIIMHAYEGGHQDHDAVHVLGVLAAQRSGTLAAARQFMLYRATTWPLIPHVMFRPLEANGTVEMTAITLRERLRYLWLCLSYRSQLVALLGLWPLIALDYLVLGGRQKLQPVALARLTERPHVGPLLYERRGRGSFDDFHVAANRFLRSGRRPWRSSEASMKPRA
jgi:LmbE family N-acetylglucosaminyl deacetylase